MVMLAQPNFVNILQGAFGGQNPANNAAATALAPGLGAFAGNAPAPVAQPELPMPNINFEALSKVSDPEMQKMVLQWLMGLAMQREEIRAKQQGLQMGSMPFRYSQLPQEKWGEAAEIEAGIKPRAGSLDQTAGNRDLNELAKWQMIIKNATESVYNKNEGVNVTRTRPGQQNLLSLAEKNIAAIEKRMTAEAAKELGVPTSKLASPPTNSVEQTMAHIQAVNELLQRAQKLSIDRRQKISAAMRNNYTVEEILESMGEEGAGD